MTPARLAISRPLRAAAYPPVTVLYRRAGAEYLQDGHTQRVRVNARVIPVDFDATKLPPLSVHGDVTDAYLALLAREHGLQLATLDVPLTKKPWALSVAFRPFEKLTQG